jgi:hypothetical protein
MIQYSSTVAIARPPDVVFPYVIEPEKQALWSDVQMRRLTAGPLGQGSRIEITFGLGPIRTALQLEFDRVEPGRLVGWRTVTNSAIRWQGEYRLSPDGAAGTTVAQSGTMTFHGPWRLLEPIAGAEIRNGEIKELDRLKAVVEAT